MSRGHLEFCRPVLQLFRGPAKQWGAETLWEVMTCCVIMHNMTVEDKGEDAAAALDLRTWVIPIELSNQNLVVFGMFVQMHQKFRHRATQGRFD